MATKYDIYFVVYTAGYAPTLAAACCFSTYLLTAINIGPDPTLRDVVD